MSDVPSVQRFDIQSEGPIEPWLHLTARLGQISHYTESVGRTAFEEPVKQLSLFTGPDKAAVALLGTVAEMTASGGNRWVGPPIPNVAAMIEAWLSSVEYPDTTHCDGISKKGWRLASSPESIWSSEHCIVQPAWQEYGK